MAVRGRIRSTQTNGDRDPIAVLSQEPRGHGFHVPPSANPPCPRGPIESADPTGIGGTGNSGVRVGDALPATKLRALTDAAVEMHSQLEEEGLLDSIVSQSVKLLEADSGACYLYDPDHACLEPGACVGCDRADIERFERFVDVVRHASGQPVVVAYREPTEEDTSTGMAGVAMRWDGQLLGVLTVSAPWSFLRADAELLELIAVHAAGALRNARVAHSLRDLNELKDAAIGLAAHDLKGPLTHMAGYLGLLSEGLRPLDARRAKWLTIIEESIERMGELIDGILDYRRFSVGEMAVQKRCDLNELAEEAAGEYRRAACDRGQTLCVETASSDLWVVGDETLLRQAVLNLLSNAIKYTPPGGLIRICAERVGRDCRLTVEDTGPGIAREDQERVFHPFVRLADGRRKDGAGLGLSLVKTIVERHGGRASVTSRVGEGAAFALRLPRTDDGGT